MLENVLTWVEAHLGVSTASAVFAISLISPTGAYLFMIFLSIVAPSLKNYTYGYPSLGLLLIGINLTAWTLAASEITRTIQSESLSRAREAISRLKLERDVSDAIFEECSKTLASQSSMPESVTSCLRLYDSQRDEMKKHLRELRDNALRPQLKRGRFPYLVKVFYGTLRLWQAQARVQAGSDSLRDSVLLLRDLTAE